MAHTVIWMDKNEIEECTHVLEIIRGKTEEREKKKKKRDQHCKYNKRTANAQAVSFVLFMFHSAHHSVSVIRVISYNIEIC